MLALPKDLSLALISPCVHNHFYDFKQHLVADNSQMYIPSPNLSTKLSLLCATEKSTEVFLKQAP